MLRISGKGGSRFAGGLWVEALLGLFYPPHCGGCGIALPEYETSCSGERIPGLCVACLAGIPPPPHPCCRVCSHALDRDVPCPNCAGRKWSLSAIVPAASLGEGIRAMLHRFKYGRDRSLAVPLGGLLLRTMGDPRLGEYDIILPVPLHPVREREREFNQADFLAGRLSRSAGIPLRRWLRRIRPTTPQAGFGREDRMKNLEGAFVLRGPIRPGLRILLVDDVCTTGSTLDACATVLLAAGCARICGVVVARG